MDRPAPRQVRRPRAPRRARQGPVPLHGRRVLVREGRRRRRVVRLVALRRPRLPVPEAVGRRRLRRPRHHAGHVRRDPPGCWKQKDRLADMDANHVEASICFPNTLPRFCGQTFLEREAGTRTRTAVRAGLQRLDDRRVVRRRRQGPPHPARRSCRCGTRSWPRPRCGAAPTRAARDRVLREPVSARPAVGARQGRFWDPFFTACEDTETVVCMHIGSSSKMPATSPDAPFIVSSTLTFSNAMGSMLDYIFSGTLERFPTLSIAYSEGQVGWMPYVLERADKLWAERSDDSFGSRCRTRRRATSRPHLRLHLRRRDRPAEPRRHRHGPDLLRDRLPACRLDVPRTARRSLQRSAPRPGSTTRRSTSSCGATPSRLRPGALRHHRVASAFTASGGSRLIASAVDDRLVGDDDEH